jgi:hypothetical protein
MAEPHVFVENYRPAGLTAGFWGCALAILGILSVGFVFVPAAIVCTLVGLVRGASARDPIGTGVSLLAACLCVIGFASSPFLLAICVQLATNTHSQNAPLVPHSQQQRQQTEPGTPPSRLHR